MQDESNDGEGVDEDGSLHELAERREPTAKQRMRLALASVLAVVLTFGACVHKEWRDRHELQSRAVQWLEASGPGSAIPENLVWLVDECQRDAWLEMNSTAERQRFGNEDLRYMESLYLHMEQAAHERGKAALADELYGQYLELFTEHVGGFEDRTPVPRERFR